MGKNRKGRKGKKKSDQQGSVEKGRERKLGRYRAVCVERETKGRQGKIWERKERK